MPPVNSLTGAESLSQSLMPMARFLVPTAVVPHVTIRRPSGLNSAPSRPSCVSGSPIGAPVVVASKWHLSEPYVSTILSD